MATTTLDFKPAQEFAEKIAADAETGKMSKWTADETTYAIIACDSLSWLFRTARESIEAKLHEGADAREFAAKYEQGIRDLDPILRAVELGVSKCRKISNRTLADKFESMAVEVRGLRSFLESAVTKAKTPHAIDWNRVTEAQAAYSRGEMRPWERSSAARASD
jgi:hypothetical protein